MTLLTENSKMVFREESTYGTDPAANDMVIGKINEEVEVPDGDIEWGEIYSPDGIAYPSQHWEGAHNHVGGLPIIPQNGRFLLYVFGRVADVGTDVVGGGGSTLNGATAIGDTSFDVVAATNYAIDDYIQVDTGANAEIRKITNVVANTITVDYRLRRVHANGATCNEVTTPVVHTFYIDNIHWPSVTMEVSDGSALERSYLGTKFHSATFGNDEKGIFQARLEMIAQKGDGGSSPASPTYATTAPYRFSEHVLNVYGGAMAKVESIEGSLRRTAKPKFYSDSTNTVYITEIVPGRVVPTVRARIVVDDYTLWNKLQTPGSATSLTSTYTRSANDYMKFTYSNVYLKKGPHNRPTEGEIGVDCEFVASANTANSCITAEVKDSTMYY